MNSENVPLKDIEALLGEKDIIIYVLTKNYEELLIAYNKLKEEKEK